MQIQNKYGGMKLAYGYARFEYVAHFSDLRDIGALNAKIMNLVSWQCLRDPPWSKDVARSGRPQNEDLVRIVIEFIHSIGSVLWRVGIDTAAVIAVNINPIRAEIIPGGFNH